MTYNQKKLSLERTFAVIGSTSVGKSALCQVFIQKTFPQEYYPTIEKIHQLEAFQTRNGNSYKLTLYDTAGLEKLASIPEKYINSHGFILVYSVADRASFEIIQDIYERLKDETHTYKIHVVLIGNKTDLNEQRAVTYEDGTNLAEAWKKSGTIASFVETSAKTGEKVQDAFLTLLELIDGSGSKNADTASSTNQQTKKSSTKKPSTSSNANNNSNTNSCIIS